MVMVSTTKPLQTIKTIIKWGPLRSVFWAIFYQDVLVCVGFHYKFVLVMIYLMVSITVCIGYDL